MKFARLVSAVCLLALAACQLPAASNGSAPQAPAVVSPTVQATQLVGQAPQPASGIVELAPPAGSQDPIRFVFPTPVPAPQSAWRPPLYPVPFALNPQDHFYFLRPIAADETNWPLANYRYGGIFFEDVVHTGVDIPSPLGTPVLAAGEGRVVWAGYGLLTFTPDNENDPYGIAVAIRHDFGYHNTPLYTLYAHMSEIYVIKDQVVAAGEEIGKVGTTGITTGPHLHFEIRLGQNDYFATRNPELWMAPPQGWGVLAGRVMDSAGELLDRYQVTVTSAATGQIWIVQTYGPKSVNADEYYEENVAMGDLPAGRYYLSINYEEAVEKETIEIYPGQVTFFTFRGQRGFETARPATPVVEMLASPEAGAP